MMLRWVAAGILEAVKGFRRVKGYADMPMLVAALRARDRQARSLRRSGGETDRVVINRAAAEFQQPEGHPRRKLEAVVGRTSVIAIAGQPEDLRRLLKALEAAGASASV
jgi:hypothetical protein